MRYLILNFRPNFSFHPFKFNSDLFVSKYLNFDLNNFTTRDHFKNHKYEFVTRVSLAESSSAAVTIILQYIYTSNMALNTKNIQEILICSQELELTELVEMCENFLINLKTDYILQVLEIAKVRKLKRAYNYAFQQVCDNLNDYAGMKVFLKMSKSVLTDILSSASVDNRNEKLLLERVLKWAKLNFKKQSEQVKQVLKLLDFSRVDKEDIDVVLQKFETVLKLHDCAEVLNDKMK